MCVSADYLNCSTRLICMQLNGNREKWIGHWYDPHTAHIHAISQWLTYLGHRSCVAGRWIRLHAHSGVPSGTRLLVVCLAAVSTRSWRSWAVVCRWSCAWYVLHRKSSSRLLRLWSHVWRMWRRSLLPVPQWLWAKLIGKQLMSRWCWNSVCWGVKGHVTIYCSAARLVFPLSTSFHLSIQHKSK